MKLRRVGIIGVGHVGAHVAYSLLIQGIADELVLIGRTEKKVIAEVQDLRDAVAYAPNRCKVNAGTFDDLKDCDVVVHTAGNVSILKGTTDRLTEMRYTVPMLRECAAKIKASGFNGILINITNPCDVVTKLMAETLGLPKGHVFGTGTGMDTSRLLSTLSKHTDIDHKSIDAYMLGEHGNKQFCPWSCVTFHGVPLSKMEQTDEKFRFDHDELQKETIGGGWVTYAGKECTEYGIATTAAKMVSVIFRDEKVILPVSAPLDGEYGEKDLYAGVPCVIGKDGVEKVVELPLNEEETKKFHECCEGIRENLEHAKDM
jgi:L-lactate dehydrogenase